MILLNFLKRTTVNGCNRTRVILPWVRPCMVVVILNASIQQQKLFCSSDNWPTLKISLANPTILWPWCIKIIPDHLSGTLLFSFMGVHGSTQPNPTYASLHCAGFGLRLQAHELNQVQLSNPFSKEPWRLVLLHFCKLAGLGPWFRIKGLIHNNPGK